MQIKDLKHADNGNKAFDSYIIADSRLYCAQIVGWINASFDNIDRERRVFDGYFK
ncbi:hypothetical protein DFR58_10880 [Anaerobacterium chartisolvens]|uniref:Uncharacterized protein n=2 Tax=Anaerobacterium chartisolvens TaxID=1297424 RepID=A0A369B9F4_9FIRM|nr:hypothetical protein DFR58_10880 [Anaerobacterium chartisolvens]